MVLLRQCVVFLIFSFCISAQASAYHANKGLEELVSAINKKSRMWDFKKAEVNTDIFRKMMDELKNGLNKDVSISFEKEPDFRNTIPRKSPIAFTTDTFLKSLKVNFGLIISTELRESIIDDFYEFFKNSTPDEEWSMYALDVDYDDNESFFLVAKSGERSLGVSVYYDYKSPDWGN